MIVVRFQRANGLGATYRIEDDAQLQQVMDLANRTFGDPLKVLQPPKPKDKTHRKRGGPR